MVVVCGVVVVRGSRGISVLLASGHTNSHSYYNT
jgi:hypothetical protein